MELQCPLSTAFIADCVKAEKYICLITAQSVYVCDSFSIEEHKQVETFKKTQEGKKGNHYIL